MLKTCFSYHKVCVWLCVWLCVCVCVCLFLCTSVCVSVCTYIPVCVHISVYLCCVCVFVHICMCLCVHIYSCARLCQCVCVHTSVCLCCVCVCVCVCVHRVDLASAADLGALGGSISPARSVSRPDRRGLTAAGEHSNKKVCFVFAGPEGGDCTTHRTCLWCEPPENKAYILIYLYIYIFTYIYIYITSTASKPLSHQLSILPISNFLLIALFGVFV